MPQFTLATFNLYQWARPATWWYARTELDRDGVEIEAKDNTNPPDAWQAKRAFLDRVLTETAPDVIAFQEVFSVADLRAAVAAHGYALHVLPEAEPDPVTGAEANLRADGVYRFPHVALAAKVPLAGPVRTVPFRPDAVPDGLLAADTGFRRPPVVADFRIEGLDRPLTAVALHLKSQSAGPDTDAVVRLPDWDARWREHLRQRAMADARQIIWRSAEALSLYLHAAEGTAADPGWPLAFLGDLNGTPDSVTMRILTQAERPRTIARRRSDALPEEAKAARYRHVLHDLHAAADRRPTHFGWPSDSVLDYILTTDALSPGNPARAATLVAARVRTDLRSEGADNRRESDHVPVTATFEAGGG